MFSVSFYEGISAHNFQINNIYCPFLSLLNALWGRVHVHDGIFLLAVWRWVFKMHGNFSGEGYEINPQVKDIKFKFQKRILLFVKMDVSSL